jgi:hypothetical protein
MSDEERQARSRMSGVCNVFIRKTQRNERREGKKQRRSAEGKRLAEGLGQSSLCRVKFNWDSQLEAKPVTFACASNQPKPGVV